MFSISSSSKNSRKIVRNLYTSKSRHNHYKVLNLSKNCKYKEIKESFITLSKKHHPDLNKSEDAHEKILKINEAYKVLSNTESRRIYDLGLASSGYKGRNTNIHYHEQTRNNAWNDPSFYENRDKSRDKYYESQPYYGVDGLKRTTNFKVVIICLLIATLAVGFQLFAIKKSFDLQREALIEKSKIAYNSLKTTRETANRNGNQVQIELLKQRFAVKDKTE